jgi:spore maturation protein CgeB
VKILFIGQVKPGQTSGMRAQALGALGHEVVTVDSTESWIGASYLGRHLQQRAERGPAIERLNRAVRESAAQLRPKLVWAEKQEYLQPETIELLQRSAKVVHFTPDPYFTLTWKRTRLADQCMPLYDVVFTCKRYELERYTRICRQVIYMPLGFDEKIHRPQPVHDPCDVVFVGGWEPRREELLAVVARSGATLKIWGYAWDHQSPGWSPRRWLRLRRLAGRERFSLRLAAELAGAVAGGEVYGEQYAAALSAGRMGIGFLRRICPDEHTTRTFEIPACGSLLIADRSAEHQELFHEGVEAEFFSDALELADKLRFYRSNPSACARLAAAGRERCLKSGYSYRERLAAVWPSLLQALSH